MTINPYSPRYTVRIPYQAEHARVNPFCPTDPTGPFSVLTRGAFMTRDAADQWAAAQIPGVDHTVCEITGDAFDVAAATWFDDVVSLLRSLQADIGDDDRATDDPTDDTPAMAITIACYDDLDRGWVYQTGDNSFVGACYGAPHWGVGSIARDDSSEQIMATAQDVLDQIGESWVNGE